MDQQVVLYTIGSVLLISLLSLIGVCFFALKENLTRHLLIPLVSLSAGTLLGTVFLHMIPEFTTNNIPFRTSLILVLVGIVGSFCLEKFIHWRHCHQMDCKDHARPVGIINIVGDALHNFVDGILIAGSFLVSIPVGIAATTAVALHEIPQEIGDFAILLFSGYKRRTALLLNFLSALTAFVGAGFVLATSGAFPNIGSILLPLAAGNFLYIAGSDLIPELHKETSLRHAFVQSILLIAGMILIYSFTLIMPDSYDEQHLTNEKYLEAAPPLHIN